MFKTAGSVIQGESTVWTHPVKYIIVDRNKKVNLTKLSKKSLFVTNYNIAQFPTLDFWGATRSFKCKDPISETFF